MKKLITTFVLGCLIWTSYTFAQPTFTFSPQDTSAGPGETLTFEVSVTDFTDIISFQYSMNWDPAVLDYVSVDNITTDLTGFAASSFGTTFTDDGKLSVNWFDPNVMGVSLANGTILFTLTFDVLSTDGTDLSFTGDPTVIEVVDADGNEIGLTAQNASINGGGGGGGGGNPTDLILSANQVNASNGDQICLDVSVENFTNILSMQYSMNFDADVIEYADVMNLNLQDLAPSNFGTTMTDNGILTISWFDNTNATGVTVPNNTVIFQVCFDVVGSMGESSPFDFTSNPTAIEVFDGDSNPVNVSSNSGAVNVTSGGNPNPNPTDLTFTASDETGNNGETVCLDVSVENFTNILSMQFSMNFDETVLEFDEVTNLNLQDLAPSNFGTTMTDNGILTLSWFDNTNASGVTVPDGTVIYQVCFTIIGSDGENSPFDFTNNPTVIEVFDGDSNPVDFTGNNGSVTVGDGPPPPPPPADEGLINATDHEPQEDEEFCMDIYVKDFNNILSMQFSMNFDPNELEFKEIMIPGNLPGLASSGVNDDDANVGELSLSWFDPDAIGITLDDNTVILQICFKTLGSCGTTTSLDFTGDPVPIEVIDGDENEVTFTSKPGVVDICGVVTPPPSGNDFIVASDHEPMEDEEFCMQFSVNDFTNIVSMQYSMNFDPNELEFVEVTNLNLQDLVVSNFGVSDAGNGNITLSWFDPNTTGVTVSDGTVIYEICFKVLGSCGTTTNLDFSDNPTIIEVTDADGNAVTFSSDPGVVDICGDVVDPPPPPADGLIVASDHSVDEDEEFCMQFSVNDFTNIVSMQYSMNFDPNELEFIEVTNINLQDLAASNFGVSDAANGNITLSWFDSNTTGVTVSDGTVIYEICFKVLGSCGTDTNLDFSDNPTIIEVTDADGNEVTFTSDPGVVSICGDPPPPPVDLELIGSDHVVANGDDICVEVSTKGFTDIVSMQFSLEFDETIIEFQNTQNYSLPDMTGSSFGTSNTTSGQLTLSWFDPNTTGVTVADNTVLFEVCFTAIGDAGEISPFDFTSTPTVMEVGGPNSTLLNPIITNGSVEIGQPCNNPIILDNALVVDVDCNGDTDGMVDITVSGGDDAFAYEWRDAGNNVVATTEDLVGVGAGTYTLIVTSCGGLVSLTENFAIAEPAAITINPTSTDVTCFGDNDGSITPNASGGAPGSNYNYSWNDSIVTDDPTRNNLAPGTYSFTVTDGDGCTAESQTITIIQPDELTATVDVVKPPCAGDNTGSISINPTGGTQPYEYSLNGIDWFSIGDFNNIPAGIYNPRVRDSRGCLITIPNVNISEPDPISISISSPNIDNGNCTGSAFASVSGGTGGPAYIYSWGNGSSINNLCAGSYTLTVTDINGCTAEQAYEISRPLTIQDINIVGACFGIQNGEIQFNVIGGVVNNPTYTFTWDPSVTNPNSANQTDLDGGTYNVTVTCVQDGQTVTQSFNVPQATTPVLIGNATLDNPNGPTTFNGSVCITGVSGGYGGPYTYKWNPNQGNTACPTNLGPGTYELTVCDSEGCNISAEYELVVEPDDLLVLPFDYEDATCSDSDDGTLSFSVDGGLPPYTVIVTNDDTNMIVYSNDNLFPGTQIDLDDLIPGNYIFVVEYDLGGGLNDQVTSNFVINAPDEITISPVKVTNKTDDELGKISIEPAGGSEDFSFQWSNGFMGQDPSNLDDGCYDITIKDSKGCLKVFKDICVDHFRVVGAQITDNFCANDTDGSITPNIEGSAGTPSCFWTSTNGFTSNMCNISGLQSGTYTLVVTDTCGTQTPPYDFVVDSESEIQVTVTPTTNYHGFNISCNGFQDGAALGLASGGVPPYDYVWSDNSMDSTLTNVPAGTYAVTVTDVHGCQDMKTITLNQPPELIGEILAQTDPSCFGLQNGSAEAQCMGGNPYPGNSYIYQWSNGTSGQGVEIVTLLGAGNYQVTISDRNSCQTIESFTIENPDPVTVDITTTCDKGDADGTALAHVSGGTGPFTFEWRRGDNAGEIIDQDGQFIDGLITGTYFTTVTDANGCTAFDLDGGFVCPEFGCFEAKSVITPEGDGKNEEFIIGCTDKFSDNRLEIFNRWGQLVFEMNDYVCQQGSLENCWTGTNARGEDLPDGTYFYVFDFKDPITGDEGQKRGAVTVLRQ